MNIINPQLIRLILKSLEKSSDPFPKKEAPQQKEDPKPVRTLPKINFTPEKINTQLLLTQTQQAAIMKDLLNLPKDLKELFKLLKPLNPETIKLLLETNSKEVINKLIKLNTQNHEQMKLLVNLMNQVIPSKAASPQEVMTQFLLLYLPWLPLLEQQKIEVLYEKKKSNNPEDEEEKIAMVVYITTINIGRFKVTILIDKNKELDIQIESTDGEKEALEAVLKAINSGIKEEKIKANTQISLIKQENFTPAKEQEVTISNRSNISPATLIAAQKITQIILEIDERISLLTKREEMIEEN